MIQRVYTGSDEMMLKISVSTADKQNIRLIISDSEQQNTLLTNRVAEVNGDFDFFIGLPLCRKHVDIIVVNDKDGSDSSFTYHGFTKHSLEKRMDVIDFSNYGLKEYIKFIGKFCYNAGVLRTNDPKNPNDFYRSENWRFFIKYLDVITDDETGVELTTPARIDVDSGLIEVSKKYFLDYSVPSRMATILHEYSHPYVNSNPDDESQADVNGLMIYLGLGYPRYEAAEVWCRIMEESPTDENIERLVIIEKFIEDFDNQKIIFTK